MTSTVLLVSGSTRSASANTSLLRTAVECAPPGVVAFRYDGLSALPQFNPDDDHDPLPAAVTALRSALAAADAVLICTPEYAGTLPGSMKNLLDWTVGATVLTDKPVAWVNAAADPHRGGGAIATLETVLGYVQARLVAAACCSVPVPSGSVGADGLISDAATRVAIGAVLATLAAEVRTAAC